MFSSVEKSRRNKAVPVLQELQACNEVASNRFTKKKCVTLTKLLGFAVLSPLYCRFLCEWEKNIAVNHDDFSG